MREPLPIVREDARLDARLDHLFVFVDSEKDALKPAGAGFAVLRHGPHQGGGSGNVVYRFSNALLELAYPIDRAEIATLGAIGFAERWRWRANGQSPFGVVVQVRLDGNEPLPFATWQYRPPFAPDTSWTIGEASPQEPLYMLAPYLDQPEEAADPSVERVVIHCSGLSRISDAARFLACQGIVELDSAAEPLMEVRFAGSAPDSLDLRPCIPLVLRNVTR